MKTLKILLMMLWIALKYASVIVLGFFILFGGVYLIVELGLISTFVYLLNGIFVILLTVLVILIIFVLYENAKEKLERKSI